MLSSRLKTGLLGSVLLVLSLVVAPGASAQVPPPGAPAPPRTRSLRCLVHATPPVALPPPVARVVPGPYYGFLSLGFRKAVFYGALAPGVAGVGFSLGVVDTADRAHLTLAPELVQTLERETLPGWFDFTIATEDEHGVRATRYALDEAALRDA